MIYGPHVSVLFNECLNFLTLNHHPDKPYLLADLTFGAGGHSFGFLERIKNSTIIGFDQDPEAILNGNQKIKSANQTDRIKLIHSNYSDFPSWCEKNGMNKFNGILLDIGVSSHQIDSEQRGFSFRYDAPLDMRMDPTSSGPTGADLLNTLPEKEIADLIFQYGEERYSRRIASKIVEFRSQTPFSTTKQLENIVFHVYPPHQRHQRTHPATRTFQALRIAVNDELNRLSEVIEKLSQQLAPMGSLLIISFHSLEDRIVKHKFKEIVDKQENQYKIITKKPVLPTDEEMENNPRSRSAKLRVLCRQENYGGFNGDQEEESLRE
jgi:16S rRNA (cytosine1402-N4)-methyltransferase